MMIDTEELRVKLNLFYEEQVHIADCMEDDRVAMSRLTLLEKLQMADEHCIAQVEEIARKIC